MSSEQEPESTDLDRELVRQAQSGDLNAFDQLVLRHHPRLYRLVYHMTSDREDTNDLLQEIFAKVFRSLKKFKQKSSFYTWVYAISVNMTINHLKKKRRRQVSSLDDEDSGVYHHKTIVDISSQSSPRRELDLKTLKEKLNIALMNLSEDHRVVVTLFDMEGVSHAEISKILQVSQGTVRSRLYYAHKQLQASLSDIKESLDLNHYEK